MKLVLKNFKCWRDKTVEVADETAFCLLSGRSGAGKSTIMDAIYFALYGMSEKVSSYGKSKCSVTLTFRGVRVHRTKCPNKLVLREGVVGDGEQLPDGDDEVEDEVAQRRIDSLFGTQFKMVSYVSQKLVDSFITLGPVDKMRFLQSLVFDEARIKAMKVRVKDMARASSARISELGGQIKLVEGDIAAAQVDVRAARGVVAEFADVDFGGVRARADALGRERDAAADRLIALTGELSRIREFERLRARALADVEEAEGRLARAEEARRGDEAGSAGAAGAGGGEAGIDALEGERERRERARLVRAYKDLKADFLRDLASARGEIEARLRAALGACFSLSSDEKEIKKTDRGGGSGVFDGCIETLAAELRAARAAVERARAAEGARAQLAGKKRSYDELCGRLAGVETCGNRAELDAELEALRRKRKVLRCPACAVPLVRSADDALVAVEEDHAVTDADLARADELAAAVRADDRARAHRARLEAERDILSGDMSKLHSMLGESFSNQDNETEEDEAGTRVPDLEARAEDVGARLREARRLAADLARPCLNSSSLASFRKRVVAAKKKIPPGHDTGDDDDAAADRFAHLSDRDLVGEIERRRARADLRAERAAAVESARDELDAARDRLAALSAPARSAAEVEREIEGVERTKTRADTDLGEARALLGRADHVAACRRVVAAADRLAGVRAAEEAAVRALKTQELMAAKVKEAESLSIARIVRRINAHTNYFLDRMFAEDNIYVEIKPFTDVRNKKPKPAVDVAVVYGGNEVRLKSLSGGEFDRVTLAIFLALNRIFESRLLMLDESIASLDEEASSAILSMIKAEFADRLVVVVAHQINKGIFDHVIAV